MTPSEIEPATCFEPTRKRGRLWIATFNTGIRFLTSLQHEKYGWGWNRYEFNDSFVDGYMLSCYGEVTGKQLWFHEVFEIDPTTWYCLLVDDCRELTAQYIALEIIMIHFGRENMWCRYWQTPREIHLRQREMLIYCRALKGNSTDGFIHIPWPRWMFTSSIRPEYIQQLMILQYLWVRLQYILREQHLWFFPVATGMSEEKPLGRSQGS